MKEPSAAVHQVTAFPPSTNTDQHAAEPGEPVVSAAAGALPHTFGLKDVFTAINVLGGVLSLIFCIEGNLRYAAYAFFFGWICGDSLDGIVARKTNTSNQFGAQFDQIGDHLAQCVVPAAMLYVGYRPLSPYLGGALAAALLISGSIRHARSAVASPRIAYAYIGMPRTVSALIIIVFLNSRLISMIPGWLWYGIPLTLLVSAAHLLPLPFRTHKGRRLKTWVRWGVTTFFVTSLGALLVLPAVAFDVVLFWLMIYTFLSWLELEPEERRAFFVEAGRWAREVRAAR